MQGPLTTKAQTTPETSTEHEKLMKPGKSLWPQIEVIRVLWFCFYLLSCHCWPPLLSLSLSSSLYLLSLISPYLKRKHLFLITSFLVSLHTSITLFYIPIAFTSFELMTFLSPLYIFLLMCKSSWTENFLNKLGLSNIFKYVIFLFSISETTCILIFFLFFSLPFFLDIALSIFFL